MPNNRTKTLALLTLAGVLALAGCAKKAAKVTPPAAAPHPRPIAPTATLAANPSVVQQGQTSTLTWQTSNATDVTIASVGELTSSGSRSVTPTASTTYTLVAKGRVEPAKPPPASPSIPQSPASHLHPRMRNCSSKNVKDVFFDYDKYSIRSDELPRSKLTKHFSSIIPTSRSLSKGIVTTADPRNTTSPSGPAGRNP